MIRYDPFITLFESVVKIEEPDVNSTFVSKTLKNPDINTGYNMLFVKKTLNSRYYQNKRF
jgi:hypothetical protein